LKKRRPDKEPKRLLYKRVPTSSATAFVQGTYKYNRQGVSWLSRPFVCPRSLFRSYVRPPACVTSQAPPSHTELSRTGGNSPAGATSARPPREAARASAWLPVRHRRRRRPLSLSTPVGRTRTTSYRIVRETRLPLCMRCPTETPCGDLVYSVADHFLTQRQSVWDQ